MPRLPCPAHLLLSALLITLLWGSIVEARILPAKIPPGWKNSSAAASGTGLSPNIVGGTVVASQSTYPFQAMLEEAVNGYFCGGSMIAPNLVLTAAHCAVGTLASSWSVSTYRRDSRLYASEENAIEYSVTKIYIHPSYSDVTNDNDVAIFVLSAPTNYGTFKPTWISLNRNAALPAVGANTRVIGWGDLAYQGTSATYLMQVDIPIVASATCQSLTGDTITARMVCAGVTGKDSCQGDSGGPLMLLQGSTWLQIGIVSFGNGCGTQPGVYARVSALSSWIDGIIKVHYPAVLPASATATKTKTKTKSRTKTKTKTTTRMCRSTLLMPCKRRFEARDGDFLESGDLVQPEQATVTVREFVTVKETVTVFKRA